MIFFVAKIGVDTAENELFQVVGEIEILGRQAVTASGFPSPHTPS